MLDQAIENLVLSQALMSVEGNGHIADTQRVADVGIFARDADGQLNVSLIGIKPIIKCVSQRSCEHVETRPSLSGTGEKFFLDFSSLDKSPEFAYESTSFDYEFVSQPHDG